MTPLFQMELHHELSAILQLPSAEAAADPTWSSATSKVLSGKQKLNKEVQALSMVLFHFPPLQHPH